VTTRLTAKSWSRYGRIAPPAEADQTIKSCLLRADAIDLAKLPGNTLASDLDKGEEPTYLRPHAGAALALLAYRGGNAVSAVEYVTNSQKMSSRDFIQAMNLAVPAMAQHQLHHPDLARRALREASQVTGRLPADANHPGHHKALIAKILLREAEDLINGKPKPKPARATAEHTGDKKP